MPSPNESGTRLRFYWQGWTHRVGVKFYRHGESPGWTACLGLAIVTRNGEWADA